MHAILRPCKCCVYVRRSQLLQMLDGYLCSLCMYMDSSARKGVREKERIRCLFFSCGLRSTVNTASRMESLGAVDCIHISPDTHQLVRHESDEFRFQCRGPVQVKGKGIMTTWWADAADAQHVGPYKEVLQPPPAPVQQPCAGMLQPSEYAAGGVLLPATTLLDPGAAVPAVAQPREVSGSMLP